MDLHVSYLTFLLATAWLTRNVKGLPPGATCVSGQNKGRAINMNSDSAGFIQLNQTEQKFCLPSGCCVD